MAYTPNFNDPRVKKRIKRALGFAIACFNSDKERSWSTRYIDRYFGISSNPLSKYLRDTLLICTDPHYSSLSHVSKKYKLNPQGVSNLQTGSMPICVLQVEAVDWAKEEFNEELSTRVFKYTNKSNRNWHPLQRVRREVKRQVFHDSNLKYQYDIQCCAPRLLLQYSQQIPEVLDPIKQVGPQNNKRAQWLQGPMDLWLPNLQAYLKDRNQIRNELAQRAEITPDLAKEIINALFAGARIALNEDSDIYQLLEGDIARIHYLKQDPFISGLRDEIKTMWDYIKPTLQKRTITTKTGQIKQLGISSKQKWNLYFALEMQVLSAITDYLSKTNNKFFTEHDGWVCENEVDQISLRNFVRTKTGFDIELDLEIL
jgi:predicted 2-oxoglutarate/Fe(II)-dependent dioxygenase YbiX